MHFAASMSLYYVVIHLIAVMTAVLYGMLVVWAVESRWHWFFRTGIVGIALGAPLVLPAYELTIRSTLAALFFAVGLIVWRRRSTGNSRRPRIGLQDIFLATIVVAVLLAVAIHAPKRSVVSWLFE